jgi:glutamine amidotransferase
VIALLDYGAGNLTSVRKALAAVGAQYFTPSDPGEIRGLSGMVIPGVGHFSATRGITAAWRMAILGAVDCQVPLLGICLGMQYLFDGSDEDSGVAGLGLLPGRCALIGAGVKVPHVGWNDLSLRGASRLLADVPIGTQAYFTHSYAAPVTDATVATTEYGGIFAAAVERANVFGVQFHPEKSSASGLRLLRSFVEITRLPNRHLPCSPSA